jgi:hypothetical protein
MVMETTGGAKKKATSELLKAVKDLKAQMTAAAPTPLPLPSPAAVPGAVPSVAVPRNLGGIVHGPTLGGSERQSDVSNLGPIGPSQGPGKQAVQAPSNLADIIAPKPTTIGPLPSSPFQNRGQSAIQPRANPADIFGFLPPEQPSFGPSNPLVRDPFSTGAALGNAIGPGEQRDWERRVSDPGMTEEQILKTIVAIGGTGAFPLAMIGGLSALPAVMGGGLGALGEYAFPASQAAGAGGLAAQRLYEQFSPGLANQAQAGIGDAATLSQELMQMIQALGDETGAKAQRGQRVQAAAQRAQPVTATKNPIAAINIENLAQQSQQLQPIFERLGAPPSAPAGLPALSSEAGDAIQQMLRMAGQGTSMAPAGVPNLESLAASTYQLPPLFDRAVAPLASSGGIPVLGSNAMEAIKQMMGLAGQYSVPPPVIPAGQAALNSLSSNSGGTGLQLLKMLAGLGLLGAGGVAAQTVAGKDPVGNAVSNLTGAFPEDLIGYSGNPLMPVRADPSLAPDALRSFLDLVNATPERARGLEYQMRQEQQDRADQLARAEEARRAREISNPYLQGARTDLYGGVFPEQMGPLAENLPPPPVVQVETAPGKELPLALTPEVVVEPGAEAGSSLGLYEKNAVNPGGTLGSRDVTAKGGGMQPPDKVTTEEVAASTDTSTGGGGGGQSSGGGYSPDSEYYMPAPGAGSDFTREWDEEDARAITRATVGREMSKGELNAWIGAFYDEHKQYPWDDGPFDGYNNLIDHLMALGESQRAAAQGSYGSTTDATGNSMQDRGVTPGFWEDAYYNRYRFPSYAQGWEGSPQFDRDRNLQVGEYPGRFDPYWIAQRRMGNYDEAEANLRRPWAEYMPPADLSGGGGGIGGSGSAISWDPSWALSKGTLYNNQGLGSNW